MDELSQIRNWDPNMDLMTCLVMTLALLFILGVCVIPVVLISMASLGFTDELLWLLTMSGLFITFFTCVCLCKGCLNEKGEVRMKSRQFEINGVLRDINERLFSAKKCRFDCGYGGSYLVFHMK